MNMHPDIGLLNGGRCYVFLEGYGLHREPMYGTYEECLNAIDARGGVDDPIPTDGSHTMADYKAALAASKMSTAINEEPSPKAAIKTMSAQREYILTFRTIDEEWRGVDGYRDGQESVFACDRNDAMRKGREIIRDTIGRYGPKIAISARLAN